MRAIAFCFFTVLGLASPAQAQRQIALRADPVPIVEAQINGRPVRLEVDLRLPDVLVLNPAAAERLGVRRLPLAAAAVAVDDATIRGRIARPRIVFGDAGAARALTGVFNVPSSRHADGVIGPGVLPYDIVRIELGPEQEGARTIGLHLADADEWRIQAPVGGMDMEIYFDLTNAVSTFNRTASARLDETGAIAASGAHAETEMLMGLRVQTQAVSTQLSFEGLSLAPAVARTRAPLLGALDADTVVVAADADAPDPSVWIGRQALAGCSSISAERRTRRLSLRCAP